MIIHKKPRFLGCLPHQKMAKYRCQGYGTLLVNFAENWAREKGYTHMMLELTQPTDWVQPHTKRLEDWYVKRGYVQIDTKPFPFPDALIPGHSYVFKIFKKNLNISHEVRK